MPDREQSPLVRLRRCARVLEIILDNPKVNAVSRQLSRQIYQAARLLQDDDDLAIGIIAASGDKAFSAGWDFNEALASAELSGSVYESDEGGHGPGGFGGITSFHDLTKPLIAVVQAPAIGGGFEIALACDLIVMASDAYFQLPEMQRGILPDAGGLQRLPRRIPHNVSMGMILTGRRMQAQEALHWGLVHAVHPREELFDQARALAAEIAEGAPLALQACKEVALALEFMPLREAMNVSKDRSGRLPAYERMMASRDAQEGPRAFLEKRRPVWQVR